MWVTALAHRLYMYDGGWSPKHGGLPPLRYLGGTGETVSPG